MPDQNFHNKTVFFDFKGSYEGASSTGSGQQIHKKAVFFDADGTICDIEKGTPASAVEAITKLVKNGHQAWLCTGRSRAFVPDYLEQIPFTGMISACGCTIEMAKGFLTRR